MYKGRGINANAGGSGATFRAALLPSDSAVAADQLQQAPHLIVEQKPLWQREDSMALTIHDAKIAIGMLARGDNQHDVAAWFGENQARIVEASQGKFGTTEAAPAAELPPKGAPGIKGRRLRAFVEKAIAALEGGDADAALQHLRAGMDRYDRHE